MNPMIIAAMTERAAPLRCETNFVPNRIELIFRRGQSVKSTNFTQCVSDIDFERAVLASNTSQTSPALFSSQKITQVTCREQNRMNSIAKVPSDCTFQPISANRPRCVSDRRLGNLFGVPPSLSVLDVIRALSRVTI